MLRQLESFSTSLLLPAEGMSCSANGCYPLGNRRRGDACLQSSGYLVLQRAFANIWLVL